MWSSFISLWTTGTFAGIALSIYQINHPSILYELQVSVDRKKFSNALSHWLFHYNRTAPLQASLTIISCISSLLTLFLKYNPTSKYFAASAVLMGGNFVYTLLFTMPINNRLKTLAGKGKDLSEAEAKETHSLLKKWGSLHAVRTFSSLVAFTISLYKRFV